MTTTPLEIDYLYEDPVIPSQQYALVSIIGPNCKAKCAVWGVKVRGTTNSLENAKKLSSKLNKLDANHDIISVETGKFFPIIVDPNANIETEHANDELNKVMKAYLESNDKANDEWEKRKNQKMQEAIREGREGVKKEALVTLVSIKTVEQRLEEAEKKRNELVERLEEYKKEFSNFSQEEQDKANEEFEGKIKEDLKIAGPSE